MGLRARVPISRVSTTTLVAWFQWDGTPSPRKSPMWSRTLLRTRRATSTAPTFRLMAAWLKSDALVFQNGGHRPPLCPLFSIIHFCEADVAYLGRDQYPLLHFAVLHHTPVRTSVL